LCTIEGFTARADQEVVEENAKEEIGVSGDRVKFPLELEILSREGGESHADLLPSALGQLALVPEDGRVSSFMDSPKQKPVEQRFWLDLRKDAERE
jgi:hypothetical protein